MAGETIRFFDPPPRERGPGWRRRLRLLIVWIALGGAAVAACAGLAVHTKRTSDDARRVVRDGERATCRVVSMRRTTGKTTRFYVTLRVEAPPFPVMERTIGRAAWESAGVGASAVYYHRPGRLDEGFSELERPYRESLAGLYVGVPLAIAALAVLAVAVRVLAREMALLVDGLELIASGPAGRCAIRHDGRSREVRPPPARAYVLRLTRGAPQPACVALASPDLQRCFFPELRDVPLDRLSPADPATSAALPPPPRPAAPRWEAFARARRRVAWILMWIFGAAAVGLGGVAGLSDAPALLGTLGAVSLVVGGLAFAAWTNARARDEALWERGEETQAVVLRQVHRKGDDLLEIAYRAREEERRGTAALTRGRSWIHASPGPEASVELTRVVILVDADRPSRWALVPAELARR